MNYTETLAHWYLRFNGYFCTPNFTIHPDFKKVAGGTDADVLALRFGHSQEFQRRFTFERDEALTRRVPIDIVLAEVKTSQCSLNAKWTDAARENVEYTLRWVGRWASQAAIAEIAAQVYRRGESELTASGELVRFVCFGNRVNDALKAERPLVLQLPFDHVVGYMRSRMMKGCTQIHRENWDPVIRELVERFDNEKSDEAVLKWILGRA